METANDPDTNENTLSWNVEKPDAAKVFVRRDIIRLVLIIVLGFALPFLLIVMMYAGMQFFQALVVCAATLLTTIIVTFLITILFAKNFSAQYTLNSKGVFTKHTSKLDNKYINTGKAIEVISVAAGDPHLVTSQINHRTPAREWITWNKIKNVSVDQASNMITLSRRRPLPPMRLYFMEPETLAAALDLMTKYIPDKPIKTG